MSEMIERVAKDIAWADLLEHETVEGLERIGIVKDGMFVDAKFVAMARIAVEAMREPTEAMLAAGHAALVEGATSSLELVEVRAAVFTAMIDAALAE